MKIEINEKLLTDFRKNIIWLAYEKSDTEIVENLLRRELISGGFDGYEIDDLSGLITRARLQKDIMDTISKILDNKLQNFYKTILYFNIKNLKNYNDINGLTAGDILLSKFCNVLKKIYSAETLYRLSGQEFIILSLKDIDLKSKITIDDNELFQNKIIINTPKIEYPIEIDYAEFILNLIEKNKYKR